MLLLGSGAADSVDVDVGCRDSLFKPLLPCTVGSQPFSALCIPDVSLDSVVSLGRGLVLGLPPAGELTVRKSGGASILDAECA